MKITAKLRNIVDANVNTQWVESATIELELGATPALSWYKIHISLHVFHSAQKVTASSGTAFPFSVHTGAHHLTNISLLAAIFLVSITSDDDETDYHESFSVGRVIQLITIGSMLNQYILTIPIQQPRQTIISHSSSSESSSSSPASS